VSAQLLDDLVRDEDLREKPYVCPAGHWTIGVGHNLEANPLTGQQWKTLLDRQWITVSISPAGCRWLLETAAREVELSCATTFRWWGTLDQVRRDAIVNFVYNLGMTRALGFRRMLDAMHARDYDRAADELLDSLYARQVGARATRLAHMIRTGVRP
jgi:lysozyme